LFRTWGFTISGGGALASVVKKPITARALRIVVADDESRMQTYFRKVLPALGHEVVGVASTGRDLVELCRTLTPDLVITDVKMPDMDGIEAAGEIYRTIALPVILISAHHDNDLIERAEADHAMAYLVKPVKQAHLEPAIAIAMRRFGEFQALRKETEDLRQALSDRKIIEQAKGILMSSTNMDEPTAFRRLQKLASEKNRKLIDIAHMILTAKEAMRPTERE
jgi:two-component system, response regulator PdtaR